MSHMVTITNLDLNFSDLFAKKIRKGFDMIEYRIYHNKADGTFKRTQQKKILYLSINLHEKKINFDKNLYIQIKMES